ncbi:uncharacterized protein LOC116770162 [Danaus plexippus]|uniref:uncharacterized protein LOC116770162 n=1 Tax=Danaus plexippus TaxID=13037 RepID=UPI002AAF5808|nr:uncharacterized protein LOC116770162 [Danaus plexippus]
MEYKTLSLAELNAIVANAEDIQEGVVIKDYSVDQASDKMLGFLGDYWRLKVELVTSENDTLHKIFFIKAISKSNAAKADMVRDMNLFEKESWFYNVMVKKMTNNGLKPWSSRFITSTNEAMVFEDLNALQYENRDKFEVYDEEHILLALNTLARFHASSIILEEENSRRIQKPYFINDKYLLDKGGYKTNNTWFEQCMKGALEIVTTMSKYRNDAKALQQIENKWSKVWYRSLEITETSNKYRNVICHRDLWNNNIMFRYENVNNTVKVVDCLFVDFAAVSLQPPASDVMLLFYCTLDPVFREQNLNYFIHYYYEQLKINLSTNGIAIENIISFRDFIESCEEQRLWGVIVSACLVPQFWISEELTKKIFCNTEDFEKILNNDKATFIKTMINNNEGYKRKILPIFEEIVHRYCLTP